MSTAAMTAPTAKMMYPVTAAARYPSGSIDAEHDRRRDLADPIEAIGASGLRAAGPNF
jgi:hypothetical protein